MFSRVSFGMGAVLARSHVLSNGYQPVVSGAWSAQIGEAGFGPDWSASNRLCYVIEAVPVAYEFSVASRGPRAWMGGASLELSEAWEIIQADVTYRSGIREHIHDWNSKLWAAVGFNAGHVIVESEDRMVVATIRWLWDPFRYAVDFAGDLRNYNTTRLVFEVSVLRRGK